jgi:hypothetical protein
MKLRNPFQNKLNPFRCLLHPFDGFYAVKEEGKGSAAAASLIVLVFFISAIFHRQSTGFTFNYHDLNDLNIWLIATKTIVLYFLWVSCNWAVTTWMDGEGKAKEIAVVSAYAIIPYVIATIAVTMLSNVLVEEEGAFLSYITTVPLLWSGILMIVGLMIVHDYGFVRSLQSIVLTIVAMAIAVFFVVLFYTLFHQVYVFVYTVYSELLFRI